MNRRIQSWLAIIALLCIIVGMACLAFASPANAGAFDPPTAAEVYAEQARCYRSALCRAFIDPSPPELRAAEVGAPDLCIARSEYLRDKLGKGRIATGHRYGSKTLHAVLIVEAGGVEWAMDNGTLSQRRIFPAKELPHLWTPQ